MSKALQLLSLLPRRPREFYARVAASVESRWDQARVQGPTYDVTVSRDGIVLLEAALRAELVSYLNDANVEQLGLVLQRNVAQLEDAPFEQYHNGGSLFGRLCYALVRAVRPQNVVETGVCYGISSAHILAALNENAQGHLFSIDLPPLGKNGDAYVGSLIPHALRERWTLQRGTSRMLLPRLAENLGEIGVFVHDSLHTYENMQIEFGTVWPLLPSRGVLIADDVQGNSAFQELTRRADVAEAVVFQEPNKGTLFGVAVKR